jgi:hypothetical protein
VCELGKYSKSKALADYVFQFFFDCICNEAVKEDLSDIAIGKCAEMVKYTAIESKQLTFIKLLECLQDPKNASLPILRLFKKMASDQKDRASTAYSYTPTTTGAVVPYGSTGNAGTATYSGGVTSGGMTVISYSNTQAVGATTIDTGAPQEQGE